MLFHRIRMEKKEKKKLIEKFKLTHLSGLLNDKIYLTKIIAKKHSAMHEIIYGINMDNIWPMLCIREAEIPKLYFLEKSNKNRDL